MLDRFQDRREAGSYLAQLLSHYARSNNVIILALPRGGVPVAAEISQLLHAPLDVHLVRRLATPGHEALAFGALAEDGTRVLHEEIVDLAHLSPETIEAVTRHELDELIRRQQLYRGNRPPLPLHGAVVILVDDGLATGTSMQAAIESVRHQLPERIIVAVPIGAPEVCRHMEDYADEVICAKKPFPFYTLGLWYDDFDPLSDEQVVALLNEEDGHPDHYPPVPLPHAR